MPDEHRALVYGDCFQSKMQSLVDEKAALVSDKRQLRLINRGVYLERLTKDIWKKQQARLDILQKWIEADQGLELG